MTKSKVQNEQLSFILVFPQVELFTLQPIYMYFVVLYSDGDYEKLQFADHVDYLSQPMFCEQNLIEGTFIM